LKSSGIVCALLAALIFSTTPLALPASEEDAVVGLWNTAERDARIEIFKCGNEYCGRISELRDPVYPPNDREGLAGLPVMDRHNPNPALRNRPLLGLTFMRGFRYGGHGTWDSGRIYNAEDGKTYSARISLADANHLKLRGYWGVSLLGRTETWVRSTSDPNA
jgi:uncharacterized protein (DUF2147 family)